MNPAASKLIDIDRVAVLLIRRFGEDSALVAYAREQFCLARGDRHLAAQWRLVLRRVVSLYFTPRRGLLH
jgi:hypothetical protein